MKENRYQARGVIGVFPANSTASHDDITVWAHESRSRSPGYAADAAPATGQTGGNPGWRWRDFTASAPEGVRDYVGAMAVSIHGSRRWAKEWEARNDSYRALLVSSLADRLVEAFAAIAHDKLRLLSNVPEGSGVRPACGFPARTTRKRKPSSPCSTPGRKRA